MNNLRAVLRALVLIILLGTGLWLMDQIAQNSVAGRSQGPASRTGSVSTVPVPAKPQAALQSDASVPTQEAAAQGIAPGARPASTGEGASSAAGTQPAGQSPSSASEPGAQTSTAAPVPVSGERKEQILRRADGQYIVTEPVLFSTASSEIRPVSIQPLKRVADLLRQRPDVRLIIVGYTDNLGLPENNQRVSASRAAAVREYLINEGIDPSRLESKGMGSQNPIASNSTQLGRQANRRIEFIIAGPK